MANEFKVKNGLYVSGSVQVTNDTTITGSLIVLNGITGSLQGTASYAISASNADSAISSSYALTASYAMNGGGGGLSALYIQDEGITQGTASYIDFTGAGVTATVTNGTASISITGGGSTGAGQSVLFTQSTPATTWTFSHNLNNQYVNYDVYDSNNNAIIPANVSASSANTLIISFGVATAGYAVATVGGGLPFISASFNGYVLTASGSTAAWAPTSSLSVLSSSYAATASYVLNAVSASFVSTASFANNATSASYALVATTAQTASFATNFTVGSTLTLDATLTDYATIISSIVGSNNLFTQNTGSYTSAFFKYTAANGANTRAGEVIAAWNGISVTFTDFSTVDIGDTSAVTSSISIVAGQAQFNIQTNSSGWRIKSLATFM